MAFSKAQRQSLLALIERRLRDLYVALKQHGTAPPELEGEVKGMMRAARAVGIAFETLSDLKSRVACEAGLESRRRGAMRSDGTRPEPLPLEISDVPAFQRRGVKLR